MTSQFSTLDKTSFKIPIALQLKGKDSNKPIGRISKQWSGLLKEVFTDTDNFGIQFPLDMDVKMKAVLLGACFLIVRPYSENGPLVSRLLITLILFLFAGCLGSTRGWINSLLCCLFAGFHVLREGRGGQPAQHGVFITGKKKEEGENDGMRARTFYSSSSYVHVLCFSTVSSSDFQVLAFYTHWPICANELPIQDVRQSLFFKTVQTQRFILAAIRNNPYPPYSL